MYALTLIAANTMHALTLIVKLILCMHFVVDTMYAPTLVVAIFIHTLCVCTAIAHLAGLMLYNNLFLEFSTALNDSHILQRLVATLERALNKYHGSFSGPMICLQNHYSIKYTKLVSVLI